MTPPPSRVLFLRLPNTPPGDASAPDLLAIEPDHPGYLLTSYASGHRVTEEFFVTLSDALSHAAEKYPGVSGIWSSLDEPAFRRMMHGWHRPPM